MVSYAQIKQFYKTWGIGIFFACLIYFFKETDMQAYLTLLAAVVGLGGLFVGLKEANVQPFKRILIYIAVIIVYVIMLGHWAVKYGGDILEDFNIISSMFARH